MADTETITPEEWRRVSGYERYEVSSMGRIRANTRCSHDRILSPATLSNGYVVVCIGAQPGAPRQNHHVHRLVAEAFLGPVPIGRQVNHKNGIKADNRVANLEYVTASENVRHAVQAGLIATGDKHWTRRHPELLPRGDNHHMRRRKIAP